MNFTKISISLLAAVLLHGDALANSDIDFGLTIYREASGRVAPHTVPNIARLERLIRREGAVRVWVSFDVGFQGNPDLRTEADSISELRRKEAIFNEVLMPLIESGHLELVESVFPAGAPGFMFDVSRGGIRKLVRNSKIRYIGQIPR